MYRVAVIQNGIEMQHSGYVDAIPMYKKFSCIGRDKAEFTRFSGVNIHELFSQGEKYLHDYDALILGTNATSDDDVYNVLLEESTKKILNSFIEKGKGFLICSQKKFKPKQEKSTSPEYKVILDTKDDNFLQNLNDTGKGELTFTPIKISRSTKIRKRSSSFLPARYEYVIDERPSNENSSNDGAKIFKRSFSLDQKCLVSLPHIITDVMINNHCCNNSFQKHYYRDIISPVYDSAYQPVIVDYHGDSTRNLLMIAVPQKKERIVISTMALDWASHEELLENIVNYLTRGIPHTAFIHKYNYDNHEMKLLTIDAELSKIGNIEYCSIENYLKNILWHSLVVFSPAFDETEVSHTWKKVKEGNPFTKAYHYRTVDDELVLVKYSNNTYIEQQKMDVLAWLNSKRGKKLWDNSLWKSYDVVKLLYSIGGDNCSAIINLVVEAIIHKDDNNKSHYKKDGSYDGVLAPSCGVLEILYWSENEKYYNKTKKYLSDKFGELTSIHNKMFIIRSFYHCNDSDIHKLIEGFSLNSSTSYSDMIDLDLCLNAEIAIILHIYSQNNKNSNKQWMINVLSELCSRQLQSGKWDSLSNTATILIFLLQHMKNLKEILNGATEIDLLNKINILIDRGITSIKTAYSPQKFNWENNIVTTAKSLLALYLYDINSGYQSKDFLKNFVEESQTAANYNALNIALTSLDLAITDTNKKDNQIIEKEEHIITLDKTISKVYKRLYNVSLVTGFSLFGLVSTFIWLSIKEPVALSNITSEIFMWIPIAIGMAITPAVMFVIKKLSSIPKNKLPIMKNKYKGD